MSVERLIRRFAVFSALVLPATAFATDLLDAYHLAQANDPVFESARHALEGAEQKVPQARAGLLPAVSASGNRGLTRANTQFTGEAPVDRNNSTWAWNLQLTQPLFKVSNLYAYQESGALVAQATAQFDKAEQDMLLRVSQAYFNVIIAQEAIAAADAQVTALVEQLAQVQRGFSLGTHSETDIDDTKSRLGLARSQRIAANNELESKQADLEKVTGHPPGQLDALAPTTTLSPPVPMDRMTWINQARTDNPAVLAQSDALDAAQKDIKKNKAEYLPTVDLVASYGRNYSSDSLTTPEDFSTRTNAGQIGVQLNIPIYTGGSTDSKVTEAFDNMEKASSDLEAARRDAATDAQQAFAGVVNGLAQIDALNTAVESGQSALKGNKAGFHLGIRINLDVLNAEQQLYTSERDLAKAKYDTLLQELKLKAAVGSLGEGDLMAVNALLAHEQSAQLSQQPN